MFFVLFLTALCCMLTVSAADYAIHSVTIRGNAVQVSVTAKSDCALWGAVYEESGKMTAANSANVSGAADTQTVTLSFGDIPADAYARAVLLDKDTFRPLCVPGDNSPVYTDDVYAILYADGTMVFQHGDTPEPGREATDIYSVDMTGTYGWRKIDGQEPLRLFTPWHDKREDIKRVEFSGKIQPKSTACWFEDCSSLESISNFNYLDTADVTDMSSMFHSCSALTTLDVSGLNTANVTDMSAMFHSCSALTTLDVSGFNTANVTDMRSMFYSCSELTALDVSNFDTANVTDMSFMFSFCKKLTVLNVSNFNTTKVNDMMCMFQACSELTALDVSNFDTANVNDMGSMFSQCEKLTELDIGNFETTNVNNMGYMFQSCEGLKTLDVSGFNTANVTQITDMFAHCSALVRIYASEQFVTNQVTAGSGVFNNCHALIGGQGTKFSGYHTGVKYAHIDGGAANPGYFTAKP